MRGRLQNPTLNAAKGGMEADGRVRLPNELAYAAEKAGKPMKKEKRSGRVECASLHPFPAGAPAPLLRPVVLF